MLKLVLSNRADKFVQKLPPKQEGQIGRKLQELLSNPFPSDSIQLKGSILRRVDIGEYRIIYQVIGATLDVPIIGKRNDDDVYKRLKRLSG
ncbi:type II toxin-antitoxin system RelE/ParE family toxin [Candidatus Parcubacteria bacterium]|nr:MAG: type II toxin-antitoxin system RelE/ParE family toxin [Candidatus Parcubacteria bacterium]